MKVLIVIGGYFPAQSFGGPAVSVKNICKNLNHSIDFSILTLNHELKSKEPLPGIHNGWNKDNYAQIIYLSDNEITFNNLLKLTKEIAPDIIYINNFFFATLTMPFLKISKKANIPLIIAPRGEFYKNALNKKYKKIPYTFLLKKILMTDKTYFHATNDDEKKQFEKYLTNDQEKIYVIPNLPSFNGEMMLKPIVKKGILNLLYVARIHESKNLLFAIKCISSITFPLNMDVYGNIEDENYWIKCKQEMEKLPSNITVKYCGVIKHENIFELYQNHDALFLPTKTENFGHSIAESLLCGRPVIISNNTPWNWINQAKCGYALDLSDQKLFVGAINELNESSEEYMNQQQDRCKKMSSGFLKLNASREKYLSMFNKIIMLNKEKINESYKNIK